jgi:hypothetical protein
MRGAKASLNPAYRYAHAGYACYFHSSGFRLALSEDADEVWLVALPFANADSDQPTASNELLSLIPLVL